jgi:hypothetical protein
MDMNSGYNYIYPGHWYSGLGSTKNQKSSRISYDRFGLSLDIPFGADFGKQTYDRKEFDHKFREPSY